MADSFRIPELGPRPVSLDPGQLQVGKTSQPTSGVSFKDVLADTFGEVQRLQNEADTTIQKLVSGEIEDVTSAMVAVERADVSFQTMMAVRNKIVAAYEEVMRMQV